MRTIERASAFKRDYKRVKVTPRHRSDFDALFLSVITLLANDNPLPENNRDHPLSGNWAGYRECHIKPDLLLIYQKFNSDILRLARLGSHSDLF